MIYLQKVPLRSSTTPPADYTQVLVLKHSGQITESQDILRNHLINTRSFFRSKRKELDRPKYYSYLRSRGLCYGYGGMCLQPVVEGKTRCQDCINRGNYSQARQAYIKANIQEVAASD